MRSGGVASLFAGLIFAVAAGAYAFAINLTCAFRGDNARGGAYDLVCGGGAGTPLLHGIVVLIPVALLAVAARRLRGRFRVRLPAIWSAGAVLWLLAAWVVQLVLLRGTA